MWAARVETVVSTVSKQGKVLSLLSPFYSIWDPADEMVLLTFKVSPLCLINAFLKHPHVHMQKSIAMAILTLVKMTRKLILTS